jgi:ferric-dicitrate binding protein FerR (iron transport regulator)
MRDPDYEAPIGGMDRLPRSIEPARDLWPGVSRRLPAWRRRMLLTVGALAAAAGIAVIVWPRGPLVETTVMAGNPRITRAGVTTNDSSRARLSLTIGDVIVEPRSDLRVLAVGPGEQRFALRRGTIAARVLAPPRVFVVETPATVATDLGCAYVLQVDSLGNGLLRVTAGQVELATGGRLVIVPAGAVAAIRAGFGPGSARREDAPAALVGALDALDFGNGQRGAVDSALAAARVEDGLSLWHLLSRVSPDLRGRVFDGLARLVPPPDGVTRDGVIAQNREMLDLWWNYLPGTGYRK